MTQGRPPRLRNAIGWNFTLNFGQRLTSTLVTFALAGLLGPSAFGTVAIASLLIQFLQVGFQQGFAPAIIQRPEVDQQLLDSTFRVVMLGSFGVLLAAVALSFPLGALMDNPDVSWVIQVLSLQLPIMALGVVQSSLLRRASDFRPLSIRTNTAVFVGGVAGLALAFAGAGIVSLIVQQLTTAIVSTALVWRLTEWRPSLRRPASVRGAAVREVRAFARRVSVASVAQVTTIQVDAFFVGALFGARAVGFYRLAQRLVGTVLDVTLRTFQSAYLSDLARFDSGRPEFVRRCLLQQRVACTLSLPVLGLVAGSGGALLQLLGEEWRPAAVPITLLALGSTGMVFTNLTAPILQAAGRPGLLARARIASATLTVLTFVAVALVIREVGGEPLEIVALARGILATTVLVALDCFVLRRALDYPVVRSLLIAVPGVASAAAACVAGLTVHAALDAGSVPLDIGLTLAASAAAAGSTIALLEPKLVRDVVAGARRVRQARTRD